jgi:D-alanine-D-alanine ligase
MGKLQVGILYGGRSVEHGVSINSARNIAEYIDRNKFEPHLFGIDLSGKWLNTKEVMKDFSTGIAVDLSLDPARPVLKAGATISTLDVVFPLLHGTDGEDGSVQGLLQAMSLPCVGSGVLGSALSMNKIVAKQLMQSAGLPIGKFLYFNKLDKDKIAYTEIVKQLGLPFMVKSASLGSSVGVSKVKSEADFAKALEDSFQYDDEVLFEEFIKGREIECAVLGNYPPQASLPGEIVINPKYDFYTFDAKYVDPEAVRIDVPAKLDASVASEIQKASVKAFQTLRCLDYARVDLFLTADNKIYLNEINTIPGFTNSSMFPMMWKERGISFTDLITQLIETALERHKKSTDVKRNFQSNLKY